jgi:hypothetical protein
MLPLWIIDITTNSSRRQSFLELLQKVEYVHIPDEFKFVPANTDASDSFFSDKESEETSISNKLENGNSKSDKSAEELRKEEEKRLAQKESIIKGNYWYYSAFDDPFRNIDLDNHPIENLYDENGELLEEGIAKLTYDLQEKIVKAGKDFIWELRHSNARPYQTINIVVLGDATEQFTQMLFPSLAIILQKEKGRYLPAHIHQGISIYGALYIPCDINTYEVKKRNALLHLIDEIEVQNKLSKVRGYDHMMLYQNVQNRTQCHYPLLNDQQLSEYLLQCLVHLFLACDVNHPLISGTMSDEILYFSMGAASVYFDMNAEDAKEANLVASELVMKFKKRTTDEVEERDELKLLEDKYYKASEIIGGLITVENLDLNSVDLGKPSPHPIIDMLHKQLKRLYYNTWLRFFPLRLLQKISDYIDKNTSDRLDTVSAKCTKYIKVLEKSITPAIKRVLSKVNANEGALTAIENLFKDVESELSQEHENISEQIESNLWERIRDSKHNFIPKNQEDFFDEYHEAYCNDVKCKNNGSGQAELKSQALERLTTLLSNEPTALSVITRSTLLGILMVLGLMPLLYIMNVGEGLYLGAQDHIALWSTILFLIPFFISLIQFLLYQRKLNQVLRVLRAYYTHDGYARLANRVETEAHKFYANIIDLCKEYLNRCKKIREEVRFKTPGPEYKARFPRTMFNCQLNGGVISDTEIIPASEVERCKIKVNYTPISISELTEDHYYLLINSFKETFASLFEDVMVRNKSIRRMDAETQQEVFVSKEQLAKEAVENWERIRRRFHTQLIKDIKDELVPREFPTVGEKLRQYMRKTENYHLLEPLFEYAAVNGEIVCESDVELIDVKINQSVEELFNELPIARRNIQEILYNELYEHYLFVTRWKCFNHFSFNRILPNEDFDEEIRQECNYDAELAKKRKQLEYEAEMEKRRQEAYQQGEDNKSNEDTNTSEKESDVEEYRRDLSALILWSVCPDDTSNLWMRFFNAELFSEAIEDRNKIRKVMNQDD